ncbi:hypothetical protein [Nocardioides sp. AE5]|uniref:hypothetical protein n=1 Tax=Nocardioides sp. AE5 TaxID=2962573 RepID=UPI00288180D1|nr:hypothetical protein [Nocardioides sp. AE5]MDT0203083.1 hypothetical protein [Nocardioides sp. AE5]
MKITTPGTLLATALLGAALLGGCSSDETPDESTGGSLTDPGGSGDGQAARNTESSMRVIDASGLTPSKRIAVEELQCKREPQPLTDGVGTMTLQVSVKGTADDGSTVVFAFIRYGEDTEEPRDEVTLTIGSGTDDKVTYSLGMNVGTVNVFEDEVMSPGVPLAHPADPTQGVALSFALNC